LRVVVCTKETPDTAAQVEVTPEGEVSWGDAPLVINPWDEYAVEEALQLLDRGATGTVVLGAGDELTREALKHALAMGMEQAILVSDPVLEAADPLQLSHALAQAIKKLDGDDPVGIVLMGKITTDGNSGQMPVQVGRRLGWTTLTYVFKIREVDFDAGTITVERLLEEGKQIVQAQLPVVISVLKDMNDPRYPSFMGIRQASRAEIPVWSASDIALDDTVQPRLRWDEISAPPARESTCEIIEAPSAAEAAAELAQRLIDEKVI
jgi:electron transfer flavoprotein beta subunit